MAACDPYQTPSNCPYPNSGSQAPVSSSPSASSQALTHKINLFEHYFGTSRGSIVFNVFIVGVSLFLLWHFILQPLIENILDLLDYKRLGRQPHILLEMTPPAFVDKKPHATQQLLVTLHSLLSQADKRSHWLRQKTPVSFEIVSTRTAGIRYLVRLPATEAEVLKHQLAAFLPAVKFREIEDYVSDETLQGGGYRLLDFKLARHYAHPLAAHESLLQHDPIAFIASSMSQLSPGDVVSYQLVLAPARLQEATKIYNALMRNKDAKLQYRNRPWPMRALQSLLLAPFKVFYAGMDALHSVSKPQEAYSRKTYEHLMTQPTAPGQEVLMGHLEKLGQPLFQVRVRVLVLSRDQNQITRSASGMSAALASYQVPGYQRFVSRRHLPGNKFRELRLRSFINRMPAVLTRQNCILSTAEVASLYHFPYGEHIRSEDMVKSLAKTLPAPLSMKQHHDEGDYDVMLGMNHHHGTKTTIGLAAKEREKHVYLIGSTGNGKTTMLEYALVQDIIASKGVAFIDPHGDAAQKLLKYIPKKRVKDVVYLNPRDIKHPIGLNLLELPTDLDEDDLLIEKERVTEAVVSVLRKVFADDDSNAHRIEAMLRNTIRTAFTTDNPTLFTCLELLRNTEYRNSVVNKLTDSNLKLFWREEFGKAGGMQRVSMTKGLTHRLDRFEGSEFVKRMMGQAKSTISFEDIIDSGKILICNFSTDMGEDTSTLFGTTVLAKLKIAAERRSSQPEAQRRPFYVYVDEFQNFATTPFVKMLSGSRKYKLFLTIAEQSTKQQEEDRLTEAILANVSTIVCFGLGSPADARLLEERFEPWVDRGHLLNQPAFNFYARMKAEEPMEPVSGETIVLPAEQDSDKRAEAVIAASRENYAVEWAKRNGAAKAKGKTEAEQDLGEEDSDDGQVFGEREALEA